MEKVVVKNKFSKANDLFRRIAPINVLFANTGIRNESLLGRQTIFFPASSKQSIFFGKNCKKTILFGKNCKQTILFGKNWKQTIFIKNNIATPPPRNQMDIYEK